MIFDSSLEPTITPEELAVRLDAVDLTSIRSEGCLNCYSGLIRLDYSRLQAGQV